jgi:hypothetical protein
MSAWESVRAERTDLRVFSPPQQEITFLVLSSCFVQLQPPRFETDDLTADKIITAVLYISKNETLIVAIKMLPTYTQGALLF